MKKSLTVILSLVLTAAFAFCFAACAGQKAPKEYDVSELAKAIRENCKFDDPALEMSANSEYTVCKVYAADPALIAGEEGAKKAAAYVSASPEMIICIEAVDEAAAQKLMDETFVKQINTYIEQYTDYTPAEVDKLKTAVEIVEGKYVIVVVSADNSATEAFINDYPGK